MVTYKDIFSIHLKYLEYILSKSLLAHQYVSNINLSGSTVEQEVRTIFKNMLPSRFRVTHGYICHAIDRETAPTISPQIDLIIVDNFVQNSIFNMDEKGGVEIVPEESVVGIFEIKRTLNKETLKKSTDHLKSIIEVSNIKKDRQEEYIVGGMPIGSGLNGGLTANPIIGIICLDHETRDFTDAKFDSLKGYEFIDIIFSTNGMLIGTKDQIPQLKIFNVRKKEDLINYAIMRAKSEHEKLTILSNGFGFISAYLSKTSGRQLSIDNYFFNKTILNSFEELEDATNPSKPQ